MTGSGRGAPLCVAAPSRLLHRFPVQSRQDGRTRGQNGRSRGQGGFSLIEILVCVMLVGTVILALAAGMLTLVRTTGITSQRQQIHVALASFTESLVLSPYLPCPLPSDPATYQNAYDIWGQGWTANKPGMTARIVKVEYWQEGVGAGGARNGTGSYVTSCPAGLDQGTQRLTVQVEWRGRSDTAQVVKAYRAP